MYGKIISINVSKVKGVKKTPVEEVILVENHGISGDAHAGNWHRQISMLSIESIEKARKWGIDVNAGDFAENITIEGVEVWKLPLKTRAIIGTVELEISQIGKQCHDKCEIAKIVGRCVMPAEGIFLKVLRGGKIKVNDVVEFCIPDK
ncbi:MAG TPA: MOSC domain-containing protein [Pseudothermotoga sp.]|nr:MOSC domain-containing protein [Pseudothermotoga sp.]HBT25630.1 MOSC domain-containing protein [Pseudothermotoga sp.]